MKNFEAMKVRVGSSGGIPCPACLAAAPGMSVLQIVTAYRQKEVSVDSSSIYTLMLKVVLVLRAAVMSCSVVCRSAAQAVTVV